MGECDPGAPMTDQASSDRNPDYTHADFAYKLKVQILPNDQENRGEFDNGVDFRIGDPNVHFRAAAAKSYETTEDIGKPDWSLLFGFILARMSHLHSFPQCMSSLITVISPTWTILTPHYSIGLQWQPGGPAVLAGRALLESSVTWCSSLSAKRVVYHTWAGTFVLTALCLLFPGLHIVLLDSDCVPVTLFEVEDLWQEAQRLQHCGFPVLFQPAVGLGA